MNQEKKALLIKYGICFCIATLITLIVFAIKGFFTDNIAVNIQIISDGFFVSGILMTMFAGMWYISNEGALLGISYVITSVIQTFIPMGRANHESYAKYRERKLGEKKKSVEGAVLVVGLLFLAVGIIFTLIWYVNFYNKAV